MPAAAARHTVGCSRRLPSAPKARPVTQASSRESPAHSTNRGPAPVRTYLRSARLLAFSYVAVSIGAVLLPLAFPWRAPLWLASGVVSLILGAHLARGRTGPRWFLAGCGWLLVILALSLAFLVGDPLGLLGAVFAVPILALVTGKVSPRGKKALVTTHVVFSGSWLGVGVVMVTLTVLGLRSDDAATVQVSYELLELFDMTILPWSSIGAILSGIAVSLTSKWGLVRHYWIITKLVIAITIIASAFSFLHRWVVSAAERSAQFAAAAGDGAGVGELGVWLVTGFGTAVFFVALAMVLSVYKPWGKTRFAGR